MKKTIIVLSIFAVCLIIGLFLQLDRDSKLKNTIKTKAIVTYRDKQHTKGWDAVVTYKVNNIELESGLNCDCRDIEIGDTVLIEYAESDPKLAVMVDKYYMQKYKHLKDQ